MDENRRFAAARKPRDRVGFGAGLLAGSALFLGAMMSACTQEAPQAGQAGSPNPPASAQPTIQRGAPDSASPEASPVTRAATVQPSPETGAARASGPAEGTITYLFNTSLPPDWLDPQGNSATVTPYVFQYALHDAVVKHLPGQPFAPSLAESYDIAEDFRSATFTLRDGIKFHDGEPVTSEDVKFTFENYHGAGANVLHEKTERIETPDARTVIFRFKEPFLDFLTLYGSPATGAGWVVPKKYYEEVGPDGFKQKPIGAGPYRFVRQVAGSEVEFEAVADYWRIAPTVETFVIKGVTEDATRLAAIQTGEADLNVTVQGLLVDTARQDPNLKLTGVMTGGTFWLEMPGFEEPDHPFNNVKVRQAVSLALDRQAMGDAEEAGFAGMEGNWIPSDWPGALERPLPEHNLEQAKQLMVEAGYPAGFEVPDLTPFPPYFSMGERIISALREIGIRTRLSSMERGAFLTKVSGGPGQFQGLLLNYASQPGDAASRIRTYATCGSNSSRICLPEIEEKLKQYDASVDLQEREQLIKEIQSYMLDNYIFIPVYRHAIITAQGPRIANPPEEIWGAIPQFPAFGPYEEARLKQ